MRTEHTPSTSRRIVFAVFGSRGNVHPLLAIGRALRTRGHEIVFATTERYREDVLRAGMTFHPLRPDPLPAPGEALTDKRKGDSASGLRDIVFRRVEETYRDLLSAAANADLLVFPMFIFPGPLAAERLGVPWVEVHFTPGTFNSIYDPPFLTPLPWLYRWQRLTPLVPRLFNPIARAAVRSWHTPLYELREREGFARTADTPLLGGLRSPWLTLALFSECLGSKQADWPTPAQITGFPFYDEPSNALVPAIDLFLSTGTAPLVATLGSVMTEDRSQFFEESIKVASKLGRRLLLIAGEDAHALNATARPESVLIADYAPYSLVFPHACVIILSGSIGPISHAMRAGKPMLIAAAGSKADQPDNALRAERLEIARWLLLSSYTRDTALPLLEDLLRDPRYPRRAKHVAAEMRPEDGLGAACNALEELLENRASIRRR